MRDFLEVPILITSGYRSPLVNRAVGSSSTRQQLSGNAVYYKALAFKTLLKIARKLVANKLRIGFDQLIQEGGWVTFLLSRATRAVKF